MTPPPPICTSYMHVALRMFYRIVYKLTAAEKNIYQYFSSFAENPKCSDAPGCGKWEQPMIKNPKYKGKWRPPMIDNPNYQVSHESV